MPRVCTVCSHPDRAAIDEAVTRGESFRRVAPQHGVSDRALRRHAAEHVSAAIVKAHEAREATRADDLLGILREAVKDARRLRDKAEKDGDYRCAVAAVKTLSDIVEKLADVAERLSKSGAEEPRTLAEFMTRLAKKREAELAARASADPTAPVKVEWVNDWRAPLVVPPREPAA